MAIWMVILEIRDDATGDPRREVFEVTPPPEPGRERLVLAELVRGIHPGATEVAHDGATTVFDDGGRRIAASFRVGDAPAGGGRAGPPDTPGAQGTLFDAG